MESCITLTSLCFILTKWSAERHDAAMSTGGQTVKVAIGILDCQDILAGEFWLMQWPMLSQRSPSCFAPALLPVSMLG